MAIAAPFPSVRATSVRPVRPVRPNRPRTHVRLTRRGRAVLFLAASAALAGMVIGSGQWAGAADGSVPQAGPSGPATAVVVVQPGDSLWAIAQAVAPGADPRETVLRLRELNGLGTAVVVPGQSIVVPRVTAGE